MTNGAGDQRDGDAGRYDHRCGIRRSVVCKQIQACNKAENNAKRENTVLILVSFIVVVIERAGYTVGNKRKDE